MENQTFLNDNYIKINHISSKCMRIFTILIVVMWGLAYFTNGCDRLALSVTMFVCCLFSLLPTFIIDIMKYNKSLSIKFVIIAIAVLICTLMSAILSHMALVVWIFPMLIASLYYNKTVVLYTSLISTIGVILANFINESFQELTIAPIFSDFTENILFTVSPCILSIFILSFVAYFIVSRNSDMMNNVMAKVEEMNLNQKELIYTFAELSESKSKSTGEHIKRVSEYMRVLGKASGFDDEYTDKLATAAMMHDIGKLMISEEILDKPSRLTDEEFAIMKSHVLYGDALLENCPGEIMQIARTIAREHHERWDGSGYLGMKGEEIAYISRLMAVCDVFDALTSTRYYKKSWTVEETYNEIVSLSGKHFDPAVIELFKENFDQFKQIAEKQTKPVT